jgi:hypothetical protein
MAQLTLLDLAQRTGSDPTIGLIEEVLTFAPELSVLPVIPKVGTSYKLTRRTGNPSGAFRSANEGSTPGKSTYQQIEVPMYFFDGLMNVDEAIVKADDRKLGDILANEGAGQLVDKTIKIGDQIYRGTVADGKGFTGLKQQVDAGMVVDATGTGAATETAWFVYANERDGLHIPVGNSGSLELGEWVKQQVTDDAGKKYMAYVNNLSFYMGLALGSAKAIGCVKNITSSKPLTDSLAEELISKFNVGRKPTHVFISRNTNFYMWGSRITTEIKAPPSITEIRGIPAITTDSIATIAAW